MFRFSSSLRSETSATCVRDQKLMDLKEQIRGIVLLRHQLPGEDQDGPIMPALREMSAGSTSGREKSPIGKDVARIIRDRGVWVSFLPTGGDGATPWRGHIWLDVSYKDGGQIRSPRTIGLVAHELSHTFQRNLADPEYWPTGEPRPIEHTRWIADSTNYMEVLAYLVGWVTEYDLEQHRHDHQPLSTSTKKAIRGKLKFYRDRIATLTDDDIENAKRYIVKLHHKNYFYKQNYRKEEMTPGGRVPKGGWQRWLKKMEFSSETIRHIEGLARQGKKIEIVKEEIDELAGLGEAERSKSFGFLSGTAIGMTVLYLYGRLAGSATDTDLLPLPFSDPMLVFLEWIWWLGIGAVVRGFTTVGRTLYKGAGLVILRNIHWPSALIVGLVSGLAVSLLSATSIELGITIDFASLRWDATRFSPVPFVAIALGLGFHARLILDWIKACAQRLVRLFNIYLRVSNQSS